MHVQIAALTRADNELEISSKSIRGLLIDMLAWHPFTRFKD